MKKAAYYISPFVIIPIIFLIASLLEGVEVLKQAVPYGMLAALLLLAVAMGVTSRSNANFDCLVAIIAPLSVFFSLFLSLLFDEGCDGAPQFSFSHALNMEYYRSWLPIALVMMATAFLFSLKPIRSFVTSRVSSQKFEK